ncbi:hypothetical protein EZS27_007103 [termite gut metagenome]|uniref:Uncharacterized protein n=1 Tax=termite gut metagenome TaxID=433724 RepID=A0A5J4SGS2_9ZZZZ
MKAEVITCMIVFFRYGWKIDDVNFNVFRGLIANKKIVNLYAF